MYELVDETRFRRAGCRERTKKTAVKPYLRHGQVIIGGGICRVHGSGRRGRQAHAGLFMAMLERNGYRALARRTETGRWK
jgi:hypothetical protein